MRIDENALLHWIENFYGYGSWNSRIWFVGYEEGGGDLPEEVADKTNYFQQTFPSIKAQPTLCDIRDLYKQVRVWFEGPKEGRYNNQFEYRFDQHAVLHGVWKNLIAFTHGYNDEKLPDLLTYQKEIFASPSAHRETLIKLYPLPSPHSHAWYYSWLDMPQLPFLKSRVDYESQVYQQRIDGILQCIKTHKPAVVLMYGMNNINSLKESVLNAFPGTRFKMVKAVKLHTPQHHLAQLNTNTTLLITTQIPALRHNRAETGFDWHALGKSVREI